MSIFLSLLKTITTRLISIVSKPIKIVVVIVVIVFVNFVQNWLVQKNLGQKILDPKIFGTKTILGPKNFGHKIILVPILSKPQPNLNTTVI